MIGEHLSLCPELSKDGEGAGNNIHCQEILGYSGGRRRFGSKNNIKHRRNKWKVQSLLSSILNLLANSGHLIHCF